MKKYFLTLLILNFTSCSNVENNQTKAKQSSNAPNQVVNRINNNSIEVATDNAFSKQKFKPSEAVHFAASETILKNGSSSNAILTVRIDEPFHVNSNPPSEKNFIPLEISFENSDGITVGKPVYPPGKPKTFAFSEKPLSVYAGETIVKLPLKTDRSAAKGERTFSGQLKFQACDEEVCYPPQNVGIQLPITVN